MFSAVGGEGADRETLRAISVREPLKLKESMFQEIFSGISSSQRGVSRRRPSEATALIDPATPTAWMTT